VSGGRALSWERGPGPRARLAFLVCAPASLFAGADAIMIQVSASGRFGREPLGPDDNLAGRTASVRSDGVAAEGY
jgi:hypothetical protein